MIAEKCDQAQGNAAFVAAYGGAGGAGAGSSVAAAASAGTTNCSSRSSSWRTAGSADSTASSSLDGEQQRRQQEEEEGPVKFDSSGVHNSKTSTVRRTSISVVSLSLMSSMGWRGRSGSGSQNERTTTV